MPSDHEDVTPDSGDNRLKHNKASSSHIVSALFQTGNSASAEIRFVGKGNLQIRTSADGNLWSDAMTIDRQTTKLGIGTASPQAALDVP